MEIWQKAKNRDAINSITISTWRIVEDQTKSTTRKFVTTSFEHDILEALLDSNKPKMKFYGDEAYFQGLHYLLSTPFRYPPLRWGSRFGNKTERSLLYTALNIETAMAEKAYYKLAFYQASEANLGGKTIPHTAFKVNITSTLYVDLCAEPFKQAINEISSKTSYQVSQSLGAHLRNDNIECFQYQSARCPKVGKNMAVISPKALQNNKQLESTFIYLNCYSTKDIVEYSYKHGLNKNTYQFPKMMFLVKGDLPFPPE